MKRLALALALCGLSGAAMARGDFDFQFAGSGGMGTYNPTSTPSAGAGPTIKYTASGQPYLSGGKAITLPGAKNPITLALKAPITKAAAGAAAARFAGAMTPVGAFMTVTSLAMMLAEQYQDIKKTPTGWSAIEKAPPGTGSIWLGGAADSTYGSASAACTGRVAAMGGTVTGGSISEMWGSYPNRAATCKGYVPATPQDPGGSIEIGTVFEQAVDAPQADRPVLLSDKQLADAIAKQSGWPTSDTLADALAHPQVDFDPGTKPQVSGAPTVQGQPTTETKTNPDGSTTTTTRTPTITISYTGPTVTTTTTTVTTTTNTAPDGTPTGTTTTTDTTTADEPAPIEKETPGLCDLFPGILACKKLDPPDEGVIPKRDQDISLQTGPSFTGGSCPPDVVVSVGGQQVTVLSTAQPCGWIEAYMKPIILLLASISAVFIVLPRGGD